MQSRYRCRLSGWIALGVFLLNALMPTVSLALESSRSQPDASGKEWVEICSVNGSTWFRLDASGTPIEQADRKLADAPASAPAAHCLYCLSQAVFWGLPPSPVGVLPVWRLGADLLPQSVPLEPRQVAWRAPAARAPPTSF